MLFFRKDVSELGGKEGTAEDVITCALVADGGAKKVKFKTIPVLNILWNNDHVKHKKIGPS